MEPRASFGPPARVNARPEISTARGILTSLRAHPLLIGFEGLVALLAALVVLQAREPTYEASAQILVTPIPEFERSLRQLPVVRSAPDRARVIQTAANLLDSPEAASLTADRLGSGWTASRVASVVDVLPEGESDVLAVTAQADDGRVAARVANEFTRAAIDVRGRAVAASVADAIEDTDRALKAETDADSPVAVNLAEDLAALRGIEGAGDPTVSQSRRAGVASTPVGPSRTLLAALALFLGLAAGVAVALVIDMLRAPTVASAAYAVAVTGLPVLARVPGFGIRERIRRSSPHTFRPGAVSALRKLQHQLATRRCVLLVGGSAGDGVTTSVAELGTTLARAGHDVLVLDLDARDPQLAARLGVPEPPALASRAAGEPWTSAIVAVPGTPRLKLVAVGAQGELGIPDDVAAGLSDLLKNAGKRFDYVVVDAPPLAESGEALRVAAGVDALVLVVRPGSTRVADLENALELLERAHRRPDGMLVIGGPAPRRGPAAVGVSAETVPDAAPVRQSAEA